MIVPVGEAVTDCSAEKLECFSYRYILRNVKPEDNGIYIAQVTGKLNDTCAKFLDHGDETLTTEEYLLFLIHKVNFPLTNRLMNLLNECLPCYFYFQESHQCILPTF